MTYSGGKFVATPPEHTDSATIDPTDSIPIQPWFEPSNRRVKNVNRNHCPPSAMASNSPPPDDLLSPLFSGNSSISTPSSIDFSAYSYMSTPQTPFNQSLLFPGSSFTEGQIFGSPRRRHVASPGRPTELRSPIAKTSGLKTPLNTPIIAPQSAARGPPKFRDSATHTTVEGPERYTEGNGSVMYKSTKKTVITKTKYYRPSPSLRVPTNKNARDLCTAGIDSPGSLSPKLNPSASIQSPRPIVSATSTLLQNPTARPPVSASYPVGREKVFLQSPISIRTDSSISASPPSPSPLQAGTPAPSPMPLPSARMATPASSPPFKKPVAHDRAAASHSKDTIPWVNPQLKYTPLYEDDTDEEGGQQERIFWIPNPETIKRPALTEVGKSNFYVVTRGQAVGIYGSMLEVHARIDGIAGGAYLTRKSWPSAKSNYAKAIRENDIRVKPLPGSPFDQ